MDMRALQGPGPEEYSLGLVSGQHRLDEGASQDAVPNFGQFAFSKVPRLVAQQGSFRRSDSVVSAAKIRPPIQGVEAVTSSERWSEASRRYCYRGDPARLSTYRPCQPFGEPRHCSCGYIHG